MRRWPIRRLLLAQTLAVALPLLLLTAYLSWGQARRDMAAARERCAELARDAARDLDRLFTETEFDLAVLAQRPQVRAMDGDDCDSALRLYADLNPHFANVALADAEGRLLCPTSAPASAQTIDALGLTREALSSSDFMVGAPYAAAPNGDVRIAMGYPVRDAEGGLVGHIGVALDLRRLSETLGSDARSAGAIIGLVDREGRALVRSQAPEEWLGRRLRGVPLELAQTPEAEGWLRGTSAEGPEKVYAFTTLARQGWRVYASIPVATIYAGARATIVRGLLLTAGAALALLLLAFAIGRLVARPVEALSRAVETDGDLPAARFPEEGPREVAAVGRQLNLMLAAWTAADAARRRGEHTLRRLLEANTIGIAFTRLDGAIHDANQAFLQMLGYEREDLPLDWRRLTLPDWLEFDAELLPTLRARGVIGPIQREYLHKNGRRVPVLIGASLLDDDTAIAVVTDIAELKQAEAKLRESEARFRRLFEGAPVGITLTDAPGHLILVNEAFARIFGYQRDELLGKSYRELTAPEDLELSREAMDSLAAPGRDRFHLEKRYRTKDGRTIWGEIDVIALCDEEGTLRNTIGIVRDVTERKLTEAKLSDSEALYRTLFEAAQDGILLIRDGRFAACNPRVLELFGMTRDEIVGKTPAELSPALQPDGRDSRTAARDLIGGALARRTQYFEWRHETKDGTTLDVEISLSPIEVAGEQLLLAMLRDVTERRLLEAEAELHRQQLIQADKLVSLGILVAGVAHEINNPNGYIRAGLDVLEPCVRDALTALGELGAAQDALTLGALRYEEARNEIPEVLAEMRRGTERISRIVAELRDFAHQAPAELTDNVDLNAVVHSAVTLLSNQIKKSTRRFDLEYGEGLPLIRGNFQRLEQVVVNLLLNACQALPDPERGICVSTREDQAAGFVVIEVRDEGEGIRPEDLRHVADPFFTTKRERGGTGLGLSVSMGIVRDHGGRLEFDSRPGEGTTASLRLPLPLRRAEEEP